MVIFKEGDVNAPSPFVLCCGNRDGMSVYNKGESAPQNTRISLSSEDNGLNNSIMECDTLKSVVDGYLMLN